MEELHRKLTRDQSNLAQGKERIRLFQFELPLQAEPTLFTGTETGDSEGPCS